jgi:hypothetical protein
MPSGLRSLVVELGGGAWWWRLLVEIAGGDCWWRLLVEIAGGDCWWRLLVEIAGGDWDLHRRCFSPILDLIDRCGTHSLSIQ